MYNIYLHILICIHIFIYIYIIVVFLYRFDFKRNNLVTKLVTNHAIEVLATLMAMASSVTSCRLNLRVFLGQSRDGRMGVWKTFVWTKNHFTAHGAGFFWKTTSAVFFFAFFCLENLCDHFHGSHSIGIPQQWYGPWKKVFSLQQMASFLDFYMLVFTVGIVSGIFWPPFLVPWHVFGVLRPPP